ncbi:hypothetical protein EIP91_011996 [Steccherinum ochraceum]|uniref:C2H2-type domain-containing protein n=1 Tax=Steccherinum ochraceum TaxID=92696 RepID=A0A4R0RXK8_9APHY|nr:hypothetical protein EIP91_011996 [Steccherinum ochraceum]
MFPTPKIHKTYFYKGLPVEGIPCVFRDCTKTCSSSGGLKRHLRAKHGDVFDYLLELPSDDEADVSEDEEIGPLGEDFFLPLPDEDPGPENNGVGDPFVFVQQPNEDLGGYGAQSPPLTPEPTDIFDDDEPWMTEGWDSDDSNTDDDPHPLETLPPLIMSHEVINGQRFRSNGEKVAEDDASPPPSLPDLTSGGFAPFTDRLAFETARLVYEKAKLPAKKIDALLNLWKASLLQHDGSPPFEDHAQLYATIDAITHAGDVNWECLTMRYTGDPPKTVGDHSWMDVEHEVWFRDPLKVVHNMLANPDFNGEIDWAPFREVIEEDGERTYRFKDLMSGVWAWEQADLLAQNPANQDASFVPIILGSDKTTVSVATGQTDYYPLYLSIGNVTNTVRRARRGAVAVIGFLALAKADKSYAKDNNFRKHRRRLFHSSLVEILSTLKPAMTTPEMIQCGDGYFRKVLYGLGPYIADYPEQVLLASVVQGWCAKDDLDNLEEPRPADRSEDHTTTLIEEYSVKKLWDGWGVVADVTPFTEEFPHAEIYRLIAPDLLHQMIKGVFKDHLVTWVVEYIKLVHPEREANRILDEIDRRPRLQTWTGDDSKALMKVFLAAIVGYVPESMIQALHAFLEFCYLARRNVHTNRTLRKMKAALEEYHGHREIFEQYGKREELGFNLPRQHSMLHYIDLIVSFGAPNGLCSSITESKHIVAVKEPWRRSSRYKALGQMLLINQRLDKLAAARVYFETRDMLRGSCLLEEFLRLELDIPSGLQAEPDDDDDDDEALSAMARLQAALHPPVLHPDGTFEGRLRQPFTRMASRAEAQYPRTLGGLGEHVGVELLDLVKEFLAEHFVSEGYLNRDAEELTTVTRVQVHHSMAATFFAPSDPCGGKGMRRELIRATPTWWGGTAPRYDCVLVATGAKESICGYEVARLKLLFSFSHRGVRYPCALVRWYAKRDEQPDPITGMWILHPAYSQPPPSASPVDPDSLPPVISVIHIQQIYRAAHLLPGFVDDSPVPSDATFQNALDLFSEFYLNKFADIRMYETLG